MSEPWDGRRDSPHSMQDEYELAVVNGWSEWSFDEAGDMVEGESPR